MIGESSGVVDADTHRLPVAASGPPHPRSPHPRSPHPRRVGREFGATWQAARPAERLSLATVVVAAVVAVAVPLGTVLGTGGPIRVLSAVIFLVAVPGVAVVGAIRIPDLLVRVGLAVAVSVAANILVAVTFLVSGLWSTVVPQVVLAVAALGATPFAWRAALPATGVIRTPSRAGAPPGSPVPARAAAACVLQVALALFWIQTRSSDLDATGAFGVVTAVRWPYVVAVTLVMILVAYHLTRPRLDHLVLAAASATLIVILYGLVNLADAEPAVPTGWLHAGFIRYITEHGTVPAAYDARFSWPGFFAAGAQLVAGTGLPDATTFLRVSPIFYNVVALPMLYAIGRSLTRSARLAWFGVVLYLCANWYQQDYFSPQGTVLLMYLAILATMLWLVTESPADTAVSVPQTLPARIRLVTSVAGRTPGLPAGTSARTSTAVHLLLAAIAVAIIVSHQLTPVAMVMALLVFTVTGSTRYRSLWLFTALAAVTWFSYGATDFWSGHLNAIFGEVGRIGNVGAAVGGRIRGDPTYQVGQFARVAWSGLILVIAAIGLTRVERRHRYLVAGLAVTPFVLVGLQSYGGEVLIRSFVYSTPVLAPLAALAIGLLVTRGVRIRRVAVVAVLLVVAAGVHTYTRGLNVAFERVTTSTLAAARFAGDQLPAGGSIGVLVQIGVPPQDRRITEVVVVGINDTTCADTFYACAEIRRPALILVDVAQERNGVLQGGRPEGWTDAVAAQLVGGGLYERIYSTPEAQVLRLRTPDGS